MTTSLKSKGPLGSISWKQVIVGLLPGLGFSSQAHAVSGVAASVAGWSIALVIVLAVAYFFVRRKQ
jgi:hypothetical protein